jgi:hypothetical protein
MVKLRMIKRKHGVRRFRKGRARVRRRTTRRLKRSAGRIANVHGFKRLTQVVAMSSSVSVPGQLVLQPTGPPFVSTAIQTVGPSAVPLANYYDVNGGLEFALTDVLESTDFQSMFDNYKITTVVIRAILCNFSAATENIWPTIWYCPDYDDSIPPSLTSLRVKQGAKHFTFGPDKRTCRIALKPRVAVQINNGMTTAYESAKPGWLDMAYPSIPHWGLKFYMTDLYMPGTSAYAPLIRWEATYYVKCKYPQ